GIRDKLVTGVQTCALPIYPARFAEIGAAVRLVERVHLVHRGAHEKRGAHELGVLAVRAQHVTYVLAEEALDALAEFLGPLDLVLIHAPGTIRRVGGARLERGDPLVDFVVPGHVGHEVLDHGERFHRRHRDRLAGLIVRYPRHAHQPRLAVDLGGAGPAFPRLAVPADGEVGRLLGLNGVYRVQ